MASPAGLSTPGSPGGPGNPSSLTALAAMIVLILAVLTALEDLEGAPSPPLLPHTHNSLTANPRYLVVVSLDSLDENCWTVLHGLGEYLEKISIVVIINQDLQLLDLVKVLLHLQTPLITQ